VRELKVGKRVPLNWRTIRDEQGKIDVGASWPSLRTALGRDTRRISRSALHEAAADALSGMPLRYWQALQVAIGIDSQARDAVYNRLLRTARSSQKRDDFWPDKIERRRRARRHAPAPDYVPDLVELAVMHLEHPDQFATHHQRAQWFGLADSKWHLHNMQKPFDLVSKRAWSWYDAGIGYMTNRLNRQRRETG
jgi:hypothetical protein